MELANYLFFNGDCRPALTFYQQVLGGEIVAMLTADDMPAGEQVDGPKVAACAARPGDIMHACLKLGDQVLMASDSPPAYFERPQGFYVQLGLPTPEEAERVFAALSDQGTVRMDLAETFWAQRFGMLVDRFGTPWMINCLKDCGQAADAA